MSFYWFNNRSIDDISFVRWFNFVVNAPRGVWVPLFEPNQSIQIQFRKPNKHRDVIRLSGHINIAAPNHCLLPSEAASCLVVTAYQSPEFVSSETLHFRLKSRLTWSDVWFISELIRTEFSLKFHNKRWKFLISWERNENAIGKLCAGRPREIEYKHISAGEHCGIRRFHFVKMKFNRVGNFR